MKLKAYYHPGYAAPLGTHMMPIRKFGLVADALRDDPEIELLEPAPVTEADLRRVHTTRYIEAIQTGNPRELAEMQKFPWSPELYPSVLLTNGGCLGAARTALQGGVSAALVSGFHHAGADHGEGFCTFNGLVVATDALVGEGAVKRVAVLDMDLHYGNGTAQLAVSRPYLFAFSIYGNDYWNNVVYRDVSVRHHEDGRNHRSFALPVGCDREGMLGVMDVALPILLAFQPDLILYQAGADPYREDPFSPLALDHDDLLARDRAVFSFAKANRIPIAWVLAGGYTEDVSKVVRVHTNTFRAWREVYGGQSRNEAEE
jgi:acetoin utilization deacetylase AcuC-like enzyme